MTNVGFSVHKVVMAVAKQQQEVNILTGDSIPAIRIFEWARTQLEKTEDLYKKRKSEIIKTVAERLESKGFPTNKICTEIVKQLSDYVDDRYVREILPSKYKNAKQSNNAASSNRSGTENRAKAIVKTLVSDDQNTQIQTEDESTPEAYEVDKIRQGVYSYQYLQQVAIWLHETLELNCRKV